MSFWLEERVIIDEIKEIKTETRKIYIIKKKFGQITELKLNQQ